LSLVKLSHRLQTCADDSKSAGVKKSNIFSTSSSGKLQISTSSQKTPSHHIPQQQALFGINNKAK